MSEVEYFYDHTFEKEPEPTFESRFYEKYNENNEEIIALTRDGHEVTFPTKYCVFMKTITDMLDILEDSPEKYNSKPIPFKVSKRSLDFIIEWTKLKIENSPKSVYDKNVIDNDPKDNWDYEFEDWEGPQEKNEFNEWEPEDDGLFMKMGFKYMRDDDVAKTDEFLELLEDVDFLECKLLITVVAKKIANDIQSYGTGEMANFLRIQTGHERKDFGDD